MKHGKTAAICTVILFAMMLIMLYLERDRDVRSMDRKDPESTGYEIYYTDCSDDAEHITSVNMSTQEPPMKPEELSVVTEIEEDTDPEQAADKAATGEETFSPIPDCGWSKKVQKKIWKICKGYGIDFFLIMAMAEHESDFRAWITGDHEKASGAWQIHYWEWKDLMDKLGYGPDDMYDPVKQADAACAILEGHYKELNRTTYALMAYNGGSAYAKKMLKAGKISRYAEEIIDRAKKWEKEQ